MIKKSIFIAIFIFSFLFITIVAQKVFAATCGGITTCGTTYYAPVARTGQQCDQNGQNCQRMTCQYCQQSTGFDNFDCVQTGVCGACISNDEYCIPEYRDPVYIDCAYTVDIGYYPPNETAACNWLPEYKYCNSCSGTGGTGGSTGGGAPGGGSLCPGPTDTKTYSQSGACYSSTGLGYNTVGGGYTCGPVNCPPGVSGSNNNGNTCIYSQSGANPGCFAGSGDGGFNPSTSGGEPHGCGYNPNDGLTTVTCPPKNQIVTTLVEDASGAPIAGIPLTVYDNGHGNFTITTQANGKASFSTWSGDHFKVWPQANANYTFDKSQATPLNGTVNTSFSCGTTTGWPSPVGVNGPCVIIATGVDYTISGKVFVDNNHNGILDSGVDSGLDGTQTAVTVVAKDDATGVVKASDAIDVNGNYSISAPQGVYDITLQTVPVAYGITTTDPQVITIGPNHPTTDIGLAHLYRITGTVYNDLNKDGYKNGSDAGYSSGQSTVKFTPVFADGTPSFTVTTNTGDYSSDYTLLSGTYTVAYTSVPSGYSMTYPKPPTFQVAVGLQNSPPGYTCSVPGGTHDAFCWPVGAPNGSISNLDYGITNEVVWQQTCGGDALYGQGYSQAIPSTANCNGTSSPYAISDLSCNQTPGILFGGGVDPSYGLGLGASTAGYEVGNSTFPNTYNFHIPGVNEASYSFLITSLNHLNITATPLKNIPGCVNLANCVLSKNTPGGIYTTTAADGPVSISVSNGDGTFQLGGANYLFLIGGNLTFTSNVLSQTGYSTAFASGGDIHVASNVGEATWTSVAPNLQGFFSTNANFYLDTQFAGAQCNVDGSPKDKKLNIEGSVITNTGGSGGKIVNNRDGCAEDPFCPAINVNSNPALILNTTLNSVGASNGPGALKIPYSLWQELNP